MVIVDLQIEDKISRSKFFQETFLVANIKFEVILGMSFLKLSNADVLFGEKTFIWRFFTTSKALLITKQIQIINKKNFVIVAFDSNSKMFIMNVALEARKNGYRSYQQGLDQGSA